MASLATMLTTGAIEATHIPTVEAQVVEVVTETLQEKSDRIALEFGIPATTLRNLVYSESRWDPKADNGYDRGLVQINRKASPTVNDEEAFDPEFSLRFAAEKIKKGEEYRWTVCNCYSLVKSRIPSFPRTKDLIPNSYVPEIGGVVILNYSGKMHYAYVKNVTLEGVYVLESNYKPCLVGNRIIKWTDPKIVGYWNPASAG